MVGLSWRRLRADPLLVVDDTLVASVNTFKLTLTTSVASAHLALTVRGGDGESSRTDTGGFVEPFRGGTLPLRVLAVLEPVPVDLVELLAPLEVAVVAGERRRCNVDTVDVDAHPVWRACLTASGDAVPVAFILRWD